MRRAAAAHGARTLALSPWRLVPRGADALAGLDNALRAPKAIFTSPAAVHAAADLASLAPEAGQQRLAVGATTAAALRRAGVASAAYPQRMDSEGLLGLPALADVTGLDIGLVTAPEGRSFLTESLQARGAGARPAARPALRYAAGAGPQQRSGPGDAGGLAARRCAPAPAHGAGYRRQRTAGGTGPQPRIQRGSPGRGCPAGLAAGRRGRRRTVRPLRGRAMNRRPLAGPGLHLLHTTTTPRPLTWPRLHRRPDR